MLRGSVASALSSLSLTGCTMLITPSHAFHETNSNYSPRNLKHASLLLAIVRSSFLQPTTLGVLPSTSCDVLVVNDDVESDA